MKITAKFAGLMMLGAVLTATSCAKRNSPEFVKNPEIEAQLKLFATAKESQAQSLAVIAGNELPPQFQSFFTAAQDENWEDISNNFFEIKRRISSDSRLCGSWWQPVLETYGVEEQFTLGDPKYATAYGNDIIQSIPAGSIYFGGTDPGRFIVTEMQKSRKDGEPFFMLTQNCLSDGTYLDYLRSIYIGKIYIPTEEDLQKCFNDYYADFQQRMQNHQLKPGEDVTTNPATGRLQVSSQMAVEQIHAMMARMVFDKNTNREFYIEESFPFDWMYPYLEPHGLIFRLDRQPLTVLPNDIVQQGHDYWTKTVSPMIGGWLNDDTSVADIAAFTEKVFLRHDFNGFKGDSDFVQNSNSCKMFSKERCSIAALYAWRAKQATDASEKECMNKAADFAFRQAWALCPYSPETVFRYVAFLMDDNRPSDALLVAETGAEFHSESHRRTTFDDLVTNLKRQQQNEITVTSEKH